MLAELQMHNLHFLTLRPYFSTLLNKGAHLIEALIRIGAVINKNNFEGCGY